MYNKNDFKIYERDFVLMAWNKSTELVRDYQVYAEQIEKENKGISEMFKSFAKDEAEHASRLLEILRELDK